MPLDALYEGHAADCLVKIADFGMTAADADEAIANHARVLHGDILAL